MVNVQSVWLILVAACATACDEEYFWVLATGDIVFVPELMLLLLLRSGGLKVEVLGESLPDNRSYILPAGELVPLFLLEMLENEGFGESSLSICSTLMVLFMILV